MITFFRQLAVNPIIGWELKRALRKSSSFGALIILALISIGTISSVWIPLTSEMSGGALMHSDMVNMVSRGMFMGMSYAIFGLASLIVLVSTANMITYERDNNTFELLVASGLSKIQIVVGKLISALGYVFFLICAMLPIVSISFIMGGVSFSELFSSFAAIFLTLAAVGMVGLMCSALCKTSRKAQGLAFFICAALYLFIPYGTLIYQGVITRGPPSFNIFFWINPYFNFARIFFDSQIMSVFPSPKGLIYNPLLLILVSNTVIGVFAFLLALKFFIAPEKEKTKVRKKYIDDQKMLERRRKRFPYYIIDPRKKNEPIKDTEDPAYIKEKRYTFASKSVFIIRFAYLSFLAGLGLSFLFFWSSGIGGGGVPMYLIITLLVTGIFTIHLSSSAIVEEAESETFDLLRSTLIQPHEVFFAKIRFALKNAAIILVAMLIPALLVSILLQPVVYNWDIEDAFNFWLVGLNAIVMTILLCCAIGLLTSSFKTSKRNAQASAVTGFVFISLVPSLVMALGGLVEFLFLRELLILDFGRFWLNVGNFLAGFLSPLHFFGVAIERLDNNGPTYIIVSNLCFVVFILLFYRFVYRRFKRLWFEGFSTKSFSRVAGEWIRRRLW